MVPSWLLWLHSAEADNTTVTGLSCLIGDKLAACTAVTLLQSWVRCCIPQKNHSGNGRGIEGVSLIQLYLHIRVLKLIVAQRGHGETTSRNDEFALIKMAHNQTADNYLFAFLVFACLQILLTALQVFRRWPWLGLGRLRLGCIVPCALAATLPTKLSTSMKGALAYPSYWWAEPEYVSSYGNSAFKVWPNGLDNSDVDEDFLKTCRPPTHILRITYALQGVAVSYDPFILFFSQEFIVSETVGTNFLNSQGIFGAVWGFLSYFLILYKKKSSPRPVSQPESHPFGRAKSSAYFYIILVDFAIVICLISGIVLTSSFIPWRSDECESLRVVNDRRFICGIYGIVPDAGNTAACQRGFAIQVMSFVSVYNSLTCYSTKF